MGKLAELGTQSREGYLRNPERLSQNLKDIGQKAEPLKRLATEGFGQIMFGDEGTIPWYMSLAPGADLTDKLMEGRQPGLLDIPGPGTLGKFAMLPIAKFGAKGILEGTARMGKSARNLEKAKNPVIERWHRTRSINDANIKDKGILVGKDNPNYGKNTGDENQLKIPAAWLGTNPTEIPVLQYYFMNRPNEVSTYRVRIPKNEYYSTPRLKWDSGYRESAANARVVGKGESSLTGEVGRRTGKGSLIDLFGKSIPAEYLEKIPNSEVSKHLLKNKNVEAYIDELGAEPSSMPLSKAGTWLADEDLNWVPFQDRIYNYTKLKNVGEQVSREVARKPHIPPSEHLRDALKNFYAPKDRGLVQIPAYGYGMFDDQTRNLPSDISRVKGKFETHTIKPRSLMQVNIPTNEQIYAGSISRGLYKPYKFDLKYRIMDWDEYNKRINEGRTPYAAMWHARPKVKLVDDPAEGLKLKPTGNHSAGHISIGDYNTKWSDVSLGEHLKQLKSLPNRDYNRKHRKEILSEVMKTRSNADREYW